MTLETKIKLFVYTGISAVAVTVAARQCLETHRVEQKKRQEIMQNMHLDIQAIHNARDVLTERIDRGGIRSLSQLTDTVHNEVAFQKIAIREETD